MDVSEILSRCDHTLLRPGCGSGEIMDLCDEGIKYKVASVCIPPCHVAGARRYAGGALRICTVVGFPNGYSTARAKAFEADDAVRMGADEIDMVVNPGMVKDAAYSDVLDEIKQVRAFTPGKVLKVIIEACLLTDDEKRILCRVVSDSGADYIKTSTGFSTGGATREDVRLLRECCGPHVRVKAAGGIATLEDAADFLALGADRVGASRLVALAREREEG